MECRGCSKKVRFSVLGFQKWFGSGLRCLKTPSTHILTPVLHFNHQYYISLVNMCTVRPCPWISAHLSATATGGHKPDSLKVVFRRQKNTKLTVAVAQKPFTSTSKTKVVHNAWRARGDYSRLSLCWGAAHLSDSIQWNFLFLSVGTNPVPFCLGVGRWGQELLLPVGLG